MTPPTIALTLAVALAAIEEEARGLIRLCSASPRACEHGEDILDHLAAVRTKVAQLDAARAAVDKARATP